MSTISNDIEVIRKKLFIERFKKELDKTDNKERIEELKKLQESYEPQDCSDKKDLEMMFAIIDKCAYLNFWYKLTKQQKIIKIEEYVKEIYPENEQEIIKLLIDNLDELGSSKHIKYDKINGKIINIPCLIKKDNKYYIKGIVN